MPWLKVDGAAVHVRVCRQRRPTHRICDGCDGKVKPVDSVSPAAELDFCPACAKPALEYWLQNEGGRIVYAGTQALELKRNAFRLWARFHSKEFLELVKRTAASVAEVGA